jgi:hypothetical protein
LKNCTDPAAAGVAGGPVVTVAVRVGLAGALTGEAGVTARVVVVAVLGAGSTWVQMWVTGSMLIVAALYSGPRVPTLLSRTWYTLVKGAG